MASRAERQMALREMARLADRRSYLLKEAARMINDDDAPARDVLINDYLEEMSEIDRQVARSALMRPASEADLLDKATVFLTGNIRDIGLVFVSALLAALVTWLLLKGEFVGHVTDLFDHLFGVIPAVAAEPSLLTRDRAVLGNLIAALAAVVVAVSFVCFSISWFFTKNAAKRKEARDFLTLIVTFFVGILTGWAL